MYLIYAIIYFNIWKNENTGNDDSDINGHHAIYWYHCDRFIWRYTALLLQSDSEN